MSHDITEAAGARARSAFRAALDEAVPPFRMGQQELFSDEEEQFLQNEVNRLLYEPKLPNAGARERKWVEALRAYAKDDSLVINVKAACWKYAQAFEALLPQQEYIRKRTPDGRSSWLTLPGCYYTRKPVTPKLNKDLFDMLLEMKDEATRNKDFGKKWLAQFLIDGPPQPMSNFKMECLYLLRGADGNVTRLVRLVNTKGEMSEGREMGGADLLPNEMYAGSEKFRQWVGSKGNFTWGCEGAGNTELQYLAWDVSEMSAYRVVRLIEYCGWHEIVSHPGPMDVREEKVEPGKLLLKGLWFYDECAIASDGGDWILPDEDGIFWHEGTGYAFARKGRETEFTHERPKMRPPMEHGGGLRLDKLKLDVTDWHFDSVTLFESLHDGHQGNVLGGFFREVSRRFVETAGGYEGFMAVGAALGYAAAPEIFRLKRLFPSLWVNGQMGSGKTTFTSWIMSLQGFNVSSGLGLISKNVTAVGVMCQLENYSNLMVWLDEYRASQIDEGKAAILRDVYNRQLAAKWSPDGFQRVIRTAPIVSGESTTDDAATRSRYPHVLISEQKRKVNHEAWMNAHRDLFVLFWREIMQRRPQFVENVLNQIEYWMEHPDLKRVPSRDRITHAISYAAFSSAAALFGSHLPIEMEDFRVWLVNHAENSATDVKDSQFTNVFIQEVVVGVTADAISPEYFRVETEYTTDELGLVWQRVKLFMEPYGVINALQIHLRKSGGNVTLKYKDLRDQLSKQPFWIHPAAGKDCIKKRFGTVGSRATKMAWGIEVDLHPLGRQSCTLEEVQAALKNTGQQDLSEIELQFADGDPRKGPLFSIVEAVRKFEKDPA